MCVYAENSLYDTWLTAENHILINLLTRITGIFSPVRFFNIQGLFADVIIFLLTYFRFSQGSCYSLAVSSENKICTWQV